MGEGLPVLEADQLAAWERDGFLVLREPVVAPAELDEVADILDALFDGYDELPREWTKDLGTRAPGTGAVPEVWHATRLRPALTGTRAYAACQAVAEQLLGCEVAYLFDHAIYKRSGSACTDWHQDLVNAPPGPRWPSVHFWFPLDDATVANGCMHYIPGSQGWGLLPHHPRSPGSDVLITAAPDLGAEVVCPVRAGTPVLHQRGTLHFAGANETEGSRRVWVLQFIAKPPRWKRALRRGWYEIGARLGRTGD